ncbi:MAG: acyl-CoA dehydrogenase family protein [Alphaproteobacteria bacterium]
MTGTGDSGAGPVDLDALDDDAFRVHIRRWFEQTYPAAWRFPNERLSLRATRAWTHAIHAKGWAAPNWPKEHGGMGLAPHRQVIFAEEQARVGILRFTDHGINTVGPLLIRHGTPEQRAFFLPRCLTGEIIWTQGYSEPGAGSDLAAIRVKAEVDGDDYVINGQKIWTSFAQEADWIFMLVRTGQGKKKQDGISFLLADMKTPGITVRPIINLAGLHEFNAVFFDNVRVPRRNLVGAEGAGWSLAKALLGYERILIGSPARVSFPFSRLGAFMRARGAFDDPALADRYTQIRLDVADLAATYERFVDLLRRGATPGADASILKLWASELYQRMGDLMLDVAGTDAGLIEEIDLGDSRVHPTNLFFISRPATIAGGTSEVQRNVIAKAVLRLPG